VDTNPPPHCGNNEKEKQMNTSFENTECSRCGGTGHYSYNQVSGTRCFKCNGGKNVYTKRGALAQRFYTALLSKPARDLVVGDRVRARFGGPLSGEWIGFGKVTELSVDGTGRVSFTVHNSTRLWGTVTLVYGGEARVRYHHTAEEKAPKLARALAFQASLTKTGKPSKTTLATEPDYAALTEATLCR